MTEEYKDALLRKKVIYAFGDPCATSNMTLDDEYAKMKLEFELLLGEAVHFVSNMAPERLMERKVDAYAFDWGGAGMTGAGGFQRHYFRAFMQVVEDKPDTLFVIFSAWTARELGRYVRDDIGKELLDMPNVCLYNGEFPPKAFEWFSRTQDQYDEANKRHLGVDKVTQPRRR